VGQRRQRIETNAKRPVLNRVSCASPTAGRPRSVKGAAL